MAREVAAQDSTNLPAAAASPTSAQTQPAQPEAHPPEPAFGAGISELGRQTILEPRRRPRLFRVYSDTQYLYDSNVLLADGDFIQVGDDSVFVEDAGVSISAPLVQPLSSSVYYHHNLARYDEFSQFDFDADTGGLHLAYPIQDLFTLSADFSASRNYFRQGGHEFYKFYNTELGAGREQRLGRRASLVFGYQLDWRPSTPSDLTRVDNAGYLGVNVALIDKLTAQFFYRIRARTYYETGRNDLDHLLNFTLVYSFCDCVSARVAASYGLNDSSQQANNYRVANVGGGLTLSLKF